MEQIPLGHLTLYQKKEAGFNGENVPINIIIFCLDS